MVSYLGALYWSWKITFRKHFYPPTPQMMRFSVCGSSFLAYWKAGNSTELRFGFLLTRNPARSIERKYFRLSNWPLYVKGQCSPSPSTSAIDFEWWPVKLSATGLLLSAFFHSWFPAWLKRNWLLTSCISDAPSPTPTPVFLGNGVSWGTVVAEIKGYSEGKSRTN